MAETIHFYTDAHIAKQITKQLRAKGIDIVRCEEVGMKFSEDEAHLEHAASEKRTLVTCDTDFLDMNVRWLQAGKQHAGIVFIDPEYQGAIGTIVTELLFLHTAVNEGAATLKNDIYNQVLYVP